MEEKKLITVKEFAELYNIGVNSAYNMVRCRNFPCIKVGRKYLVIASKVDEWFISNIGRSL